MQLINKEKLDIFKISLMDIQLIEASAGTGKTFTIVLLYLRALLGLHNKKNHINPLCIQQILVLTFTNAAKEELKLRIKKNIKNLYLTCIQKKSNNPILSLFLKNISNIDYSIDLLKKAQNDIDQIAIYTIHEFCQRILESKTINLNTMFYKKIIEHEDDLYLQAIEDFWRYYFYSLPKEIIQNIISEFSTPQDLLNTIKPLLNVYSINIEHDFQKNETLQSYYEKIIKKIDHFKKNWLIYYKDILYIINNLKINKRIYNLNNLNRWTNKITIWANEKTENFYIPAILKYFEKKKIATHTIHETVQEHIFFQNIEYILKKNFSLKNIIIFYALKKIPRFLKKNKKRNFLLTFNDLLLLMWKNTKQNIYFCESIRKTYPVAFIDEFQDTDIQQYKIFYEIYKNQTHTSLFLIGDPKQAIYKFRGADIFSYLYAKRKIKKYYYLDINWRSSINMCNSINILFSQNNNPFILKNITFLPIIPAIKNKNIHFKIKNKIQTALKFFFLPKKEIYIEEYQEWISKKCAHEISYWLMCANKGDATISIHNQERTLKKMIYAFL